MNVDAFLKNDHIYKEIAGSFTKIFLTRNLNGNIWKLIHHPLRSIGHFLHYHGLSCTDCSLWPRDCNFPAEQGTKQQDVKVFIAKERIL